MKAKMMAAIAALSVGGYARGCNSSRLAPRAGSRESRTRTGWWGSGCDLPAADLSLNPTRISRDNANAQG